MKKSQHQAITIATIIDLAWSTTKSHFHKCTGNRSHSHHSSFSFDEVIATIDAVWCSKISTGSNASINSDVGVLARQELFYKE